MVFINGNDEDARTALRDKPNRVNDDRSETVPGPGQRSTDRGEVSSLMRSESTVDILKDNERGRTIFSLEPLH
jgi:hypothetical protein